MEMIVVINNDWNMKFLNLAKHIADWSKDKTKVGCVITDSNNKVVSVGYNGLPGFIEDSDDILLNKSLKQKMIKHAEHNALEIANNVYKSFSAPFKLYCTHISCLPCCAATVFSKNVIISDIYFINTGSDNFRKNYCVEEGIDYLLVNDIRLHQYVESVDDWIKIERYSDIIT